ncbi:MAG: hypothetical protein O2900_17465 [Proteobacteria bacterium]|nr:hypothetical protein [Pseudomonadota bacterium]
MNCLLRFVGNKLLGGAGVDWCLRGRMLTCVVWNQWRVGHLAD